MTRALLLPSPFLPEPAYAPLVLALARCAWGVVVAPVAASPASADTVLEGFREAAARIRPEVVLAHSNAGRYALTVADGAPVVFVDAALPPATGEATMAPEALLTRLAGLADADGVLAPWTRWWTEEDVAALVPDPVMLGSIRAVEPRLPLSYVRSVLGAPEQWQHASAAYLAYGSTYADEIAVARGAGWPTRVLDGAGHLHHLVDAEAVADAVLALAEAIAVGSLRSAPGPGARTTG